MDQSHFLSETTQATLLLCAPLVAAKVKEVSALSPGEFNDLIAALEREGAGVAELLEPKRAEGLIEKLHPQFDTAQLRALLARGFALSLSVEKWSTHGIWIAGRDDERYPARLKDRLKHLAPPLLYGCGESAVLNGGGVAIVGSREVDEPAIGFTQEVAKACASAQMTVVSGGARGVDQVAMLAATEAGGKVSGVLADSLARNSTAASAREAIQEGRMTLISPFDPVAGFHVGNAMARNKLIYALADYAVVISSGYNEGGTWSGAIEQLQKFKFVPIFVRDGAQVPEGNKRLLSAGGLPFPGFPLPRPLNEELSRLTNEANACSSRKSMVQSSLF